MIRLSNKKMCGFLQNSMHDVHVRCENIRTKQSQWLYSNTFKYHVHQVPNSMTTTAFTNCISPVQMTGPQSLASHGTQPNLQKISACACQKQAPGSVF